MSVTALLALVKDLEREPCELVGENIKKVVGPGGQWSIRIGVNGRGGWQKSVRGPRGEVFHSFTSAIDYLSGIAESPDEAADDSRRQLAAVTLQSRIRAWLFVRLARMRTHYRAAFETTIARLEKVGARLEETAFAETTLLQSTPPLLIPHRAGVDTVPKRVPLLELIVDPTGLTRDAIVDAANRTLDTEDTSSKTYECAQSVVKSRFPLIVGTMPLPCGTRTVRLENKTLTVRNTPVMSTMHTNLLRQSFNDKFARVMGKTVSAADASAYDLFIDRTCTTYIGSIVVKKLAVRKHGIVYPAITVESIVAREHNKGHGASIYGVVRLLLFSDAAHAPRGYIFAQCLDVSFWAFRLDVGNEGRALVYQMHHLFRYYGIEACCLARASLIEAADDVPSPDKKKNPSL